MKNKQTILIVEDQMINRAILKKILSVEYNVLEAENGAAALDILTVQNKKVNAILLDLVMPVMDGYEFLVRIRNTEFEDLPVIVLTGETGNEAEQQVLDSGAWDFITKPYQPVILLTRLNNAIARSQMGMFERICYIAEHDTLTGLYNRSKFYSATRHMINESENEQFAFMRFDIDKFSLINSFWGEAEGDKLLCFAADIVRETGNGFDICTFGRINSDIFCICFPYSEEAVKTIVRTAREKLASYGANYYIKPAFGLYVIDDPDVSVEAMYERASMAAATCKGRYSKYYELYNASMAKELEWEQYVVNNMKAALENGEFVPWIQPKYELRSQKPCGGEALVRWEHPGKGVILPSKFIPIFERNGFVTKLDYFIWGEVCGLLKKWIDEGRDPAPLSVNISRIDMYNPNSVQILNELVKKYGIPPSLLNLELTESAYMDNPEVMRELLNSLRKSGFTIMMDDFGSGYSSLNTLKDIPVDILKIDMNFIKDDAADAGRSRTILASVIRMAGWLDLPVIVEGVETEQQVDFLKEIGCDFVQGYYFGKPMAVEEYVSLMEEKKIIPAERADNKDISEIVWMSDLDTERLMDALHYPVGIFECSDNKCSLLRANDAFNYMFAPSGGEPMLDVMPSNHLREEDNDKIYKACSALDILHPTAAMELEITDENSDTYGLVMSIDFMGVIQNRKVIMAFFRILQ